MTAKEYLGQVRWLDRSINSKLTMAEALHGMATRTTSLLSGDVVSHTRNVHGMQDVLAKHIDLEREIDAEIDRLYDLRQEIADVIGQVPDSASQVVLEYRYLSCQSWKDIAARLGLHVRSVFRLHERAIQEVDAILERQHKSCQSVSAKTI